MRLVMAGSTVNLSTFRKWNLGDTIGYKTHREEERDLVYEVYCKLCAKHVDRITADSRIRGKAKTEIEKYVSGSNFVSKYTITRHLGSNAHTIAVSYEKLLHPVNADSDTASQSTTSTSNSSTAEPQRQPRIDSHLHRLSRDAYRKLLNTAYMLAVDGLPLSSFKTLVKVQKCNGVKVISGTDSTNKAKEFIHEIANAIREKLALIMCSVKAFSLLSDGSQARKTGHEKELILIRVVRGGVPVYYCVALQDVDDYGDANASTLKTCIDDVFGEDKKITISKDKYTTLMVSATADGASVNTGAYNGLLARLEQDNRPWLIKIHCVSHRAELALKDAFMKHNKFSEVKDFMMGLYYLFKQSGKLKRHFHHLASVLNVQVYTFPKVHGTRFLNHQRRGLEHLLNNWVVLINVLENCLASTDQNMKTMTPKLQGVLLKLRNYTFLRQCVCYKQILDNVSKFSLVLEKGDLHVHDIMPAVEKTKTRNTDLLGSDTLPGVYPVLAEEGETSDPPQLPTVTTTRQRQTVTEDSPRQLTCSMVAKGHTKRKKQNREYVTVTCGGITHTSTAKTNSEQLKAKVIPEINSCLDNRFSSFKTEVFKHMRFIDPANWYDTKVELESINFLAEHFAKHLESHDFDKSRLKNEWKDLKQTVKNFFDGIQAKSLWESIFKYRQKQFPNVCLIVEIVMCLGVSNSVVEAGFSVLSTILTDRRLGLKADILDDLLMIRVNHLSLTEMERESVIDSGLNHYMSTRRKVHLENSVVNVLESHHKRKYESDSESDESMSCSSDSDSEPLSDTDSDVVLC